MTVRVMATPSFDLASVLEAVYRVETPEPAWLGGVVDALRPALEDGLGMAAYLYDASVRPLAVREPILDGPLDAKDLAAALASSDESYVRGSWLAKVAATASETPGFAEHPAVRDVLHPAGIHDITVINALDPVGIGCYVGAPQRRLKQLTDTQRERFEKIGAHIQAALRLRLRLGMTLPRSEQPITGNVEAVLDRASGRVEHLEAPATSAREALRDAVLGIERARRSLRRQPDEALASWRGLVRARWTLVDEVETKDGRYVVARANSASSRGPRSLSERERQVLGCLALGHTMKVVAYELGLSHSTVRVLVGRARVKLGARDREELIAKFRTSGDAADD